MTSIFCCGFECGANRTHWTSQAGTNSYSTSTIRSGTRSLRINPTAAASWLQSTNTFAASTNKIVGRVYVRFTTLPNATVDLVSVSTSGRSGAWFKSSDSKIYAGSSAANLGATGVTVTTGVWYRIDWKIDASANPHLIDVQVDGSACGQATVATGAISVGQASIGSTTSCTADMFFDDFVLSATLADYPIGAGYVNHFVPTSDGTHNVAGAADFIKGAAGVDITNATTDSYLLVDDIPMDAGAAAPTANDYINALAPPNATDYTENVFGNAPGISTPTYAPRAVEVVVNTAQAATATGSFKLNLNDNGTVALIKEQVTVAGVVNVASGTKQFALPPTGGPWTIVSGAGNFLNLRVRFYSADAAPDQYFVSAMIEAEFDANAPAAPIDIDLDPMGVMGFFGL